MIYKKPGKVPPDFYFYTSRLNKYNVGTNFFFNCWGGFLKHKRKTSIHAKTERHDKANNYIFLVFITF